MNRQIPIRLIIVLAALVAAALPARAFNIAPLVVEINAEPGQTFVGQFRVSGGAQPESITIYALDWDRGPDGVYTPNPPGSLPGTCSAWLSISPTQLDLRPGEEQVVKYSFTVPMDASGSYWSFVMAEGQNRPEKPEGDDAHRQVLIGAKLRYAARFVVNIKDSANMQGRIAGMKAAPPAPDAAIEDGMSISILFENTGNYYLKPLGYMDIRTLDGVSVLKTGIKEFYIFPGKSIWVDTRVKGPLPAGEYLALAVLDYGGDNLVAGETRFEIPLPQPGAQGADER
jgi:hypothetical protein